MKTIKTYHIHTDYKFLNSIGRFKGGNFDNINIFVSDDSELSNSLSSDTLTFKSSYLDKIVQLCKRADLVVLYDLDALKSKIALALPKKVKIAWRFFEYELYSRQRENYISDRTYKAYLSGEKKLLKKIHSIARRIYCHTYIPGTKIFMFKRAVSRIDYFLGLSSVEYKLLTKRWKSLPPFIKLSSYPTKSKVLSYDKNTKKEKKIILLGNSKSYYNNHLDILDIVERSTNKTIYNFKILFSYGLENSYTEKVREFCKDRDYYTLIEDFMPASEFNLFYKGVGALILNNYRQMAMGNIRYAFINGVKVYLNKNNVFYHELKKNGFLVFSIDTLKQDLDVGDVYLSSEEAKNNFDNLSIVSNKYTKYDFQELLYNKINIQTINSL